RIAGRRAVAVRAFHRVPAEVLPTRAGTHDVDLLPRVLPDVADPQVVGRAVEAETPRVPEPGHEDLRARTGGRHEGVVRGDGVRLVVGGGGDVQAQDLGQQGP